MVKNGIMSRIWRLLRTVLLVFFVGSISWVVLARFIPVYLTPLMFIRSVESMLEGKTPRNLKTWVPIESISPNMVQAVVASEDNLFLEHHGFSFNDITKAIKYNQKGKKIRGGSTISQQTAKNVFLWPKRSYLRKGLEAYFTVLIELVWSKERIMEVYLNIVETGNGIYGVEAASQQFFHKTASKLTKGQAALIAVSLPNPRKYDIGNPSGYMLKRKSKIQTFMRQLKKVRFNTDSNSDKK